VREGYVPGLADEPSREFMARGVPLAFHVVEWGDTRYPPVLLLHGRTANAISWHRFATGLADHYRVVAFDQRGHGLSDWPGRYTDRLLVADVGRVAEAAGLASFALIGHSMGGAIAWEYAARHPDAVSCLVLLDASPDPPGEIEPDEPYPPIPSGLASPDEVIAWAAAQGWTDGIDRGDIDRWLTRHVRWSPVHGWDPGFDQAGYGDAYASGHMWQSTRTDWRDISRIACPTLIVVGRRRREVWAKSSANYWPTVFVKARSRSSRTPVTCALAETARDTGRGAAVPGRLPVLKDVGRRRQPVHGKQPRVLRPESSRNEG
jgi:pimeloyl-ACP methyl ester carboxylesterase